MKPTVFNFKKISKELEQARADIGKLIKSGCKLGGEKYSLELKIVKIRHEIARDRIMFVTYDRLEDLLPDSRAVKIRAQLRREILADVDAILSDRELPASGEQAVASEV